jgi:hypothetical protein
VHDTPREFLTRTKQNCPFDLVSQIGHRLPITRRCVLHSGRNWLLGMAPLERVRVDVIRGDCDRLVKTCS